MRHHKSLVHSIVIYISRLLDFVPVFADDVMKYGVMILQLDGDQSNGERLSAGGNGELDANVILRLLATNPSFPPLQNEAKLLSHAIPNQWSAINPPYEMELH